MPETDLVWFFVLKSILGIVRRCSREAFAILSLKLRSPHVRIYLTCAIDYGKRGVLLSNRGQTVALSVPGPRRPFSCPAVAYSLLLR